MISSAENALRQGCPVDGETPVSDFRLGNQQPYPGYDCSREDADRDAWKPGGQAAFMTSLCEMQRQHGRGLQRRKLQDAARFAAAFLAHGYYISAAENGQTENAS